jgi:hypothetical protein
MADFGTSGWVGSTGTVYQGKYVVELIFCDVSCCNAWQSLHPDIDLVDQLAFYKDVYDQKDAEQG